MDSTRSLFLRTRLDDPISSDEVKQAILSAPSASSPGLLGLPYEFYKQNVALLAPTLAAAFNSAWERGSLSPSQTEARVRLLFKFQKPNADPSLLAHYRPISLRDTDYRLLARILVARINPLLPNSIPRGQIGFVPKRDSSEAGLHLQLLIDEIQHHQLPGATLLSLDQESAYDLLDHWHEWILESYRSFGAPPRFLRLLSTIYDSTMLRARYNINGYFTEPVALRCGLPQAIGEDAKSDPLASETNWTELEDFTVWAGFPLSLSPQPPSFYALLLDKIKRKVEGASNLYSTPRTRAIYANTHIISLALHALSFYPAPSSFLDDFHSLVDNFVWNFKKLKRKGVAFLPVAKGGLGLIDPVHVDKANNLRRLDTLLSLSDPLWHDLALTSFCRNFAEHREGTGSPWALFRKTSIYKIKHPFWRALASVARPQHLQVNLLAASAAELLSFPPSLLCEHPSLSDFFTLSSLFTDTSSSLYFTLPPYSQEPITSSPALQNARLAWQAFATNHPILSRHFPSPVPSIALPPPTSPTPPTFTLLSLPHGFSASDARSQLLSSLPSSLCSTVFELLPNSHLVEEDLARTWTWINFRPATPREAETHWRILHSAISTRIRQHKLKKSPDDSCVFCSPTSRDTVVHAFFLCTYSSVYWRRFSPTSTKTSIPTSLPKPSLPLKSSLVFLSSGLLSDIRWKRIKPDPSLSSPAPLDLAMKAIDESLGRVS
ncbi:uncharacterized protein JCM6883_002336 [Sporobolomyces salmoneus]|uniref:uncharacterized protein n=1 Tax=Sporobolomyces salmoneus TaxID=183962 RepID=UPI00316F8C4E